MASRLIVSIDMDGCVMNYKYLNSETKDILGANQVLLDELDSMRQSVDSMTLFLGSNRQSFEVDQHNGKNGSGPCFSYLPIIAKEIGATFDPFLIADVYGQLPDGESYRRAVGEATGEHATWIFDHSKVTILYAQIHKAALQYPNDELTFDFYDDRRDILEHLYYFFSNNPHLIPGGVTLNLYQYLGDNISKYKTPIVGCGAVDTHYRESVIEISKICYQHSYGLEEGQINVSDIARGNVPIAELLLKSRKNTTAPPQAEVSNQRVLAGNSNAAPLIAEASNQVALAGNSSATPLIAEASNQVALVGNSSAALPSGNRSHLTQLSIFSAGTNEVLVTADWPLILSEFSTAYMPEASSEIMTASFAPSQNGFSSFFVAAITHYYERNNNLKICQMLESKEARLVHSESLQLIGRSLSILDVAQTNMPEKARLKMRGIWMQLMADVKDHEKVAHIAQMTSRHSTDEEIAPSHVIGHR